MFKILDTAATILVIVGALNWFFVGLVDLNLIAIIFLKGSWFTRAVYMAIGGAGFYTILFGRSMCRRSCQ